MVTLTLQELALLVLTLFSTLVIVKPENLDVDVDKRAPGWGKRDSQNNKFRYLNSVLTDLSRYEMSKDDIGDALDLNKRRPGWGKRGIPEDLDMDKRRPGWGKRSSPYDLDGVLRKRAPGWGKRSYELDEDYDDAVDDTTRSKRRPGWGKRSYLEDVGSINKRRPGWGKRAPGWGKRSSPGPKDCNDIIASIRLLSDRLSLNDESVIIGYRERMNFDSGPSNQKIMSLMYTELQFWTYSVEYRQVIIVLY